MNNDQEEKNERALTPQVVTPLVTPAKAKQAWKLYQGLTQAVLDQTDFQKIGEKHFKKKSAWRKIGTFYGLSEDVHGTRMTIHRDADGFPLRAEAWSVVVAPNGRQSTGYHECHVRERCCAAATDEWCEKATWSGHRCCPKGCAGKKHWSHPGDIPATAATRAKNRAIADMIGAGEVSAEEVEKAGTYLESPAEIEPSPVDSSGAVEQSIDYGVCISCGNPRIKKKGRYGDFLSCKGYPTCKEKQPKISELQAIAHPNEANEK